MGRDVDSLASPIGVWVDSFLVKKMKHELRPWAQLRHWTIMVLADTDMQQQSRRVVEGTINCTQNLRVSANRGRRTTSERRECLVISGTFLNQCPARLERSRWRRSTYLTIWISFILKYSSLSASSCSPSVMTAQDWMISNSFRDLNDFLSAWDLYLAMFTDSPGNHFHPFLALELLVWPVSPSFEQCASFAAYFVVIKVDHVRDIAALRLANFVLWSHSMSWTPHEQCA